MANVEVLLRPVELPTGRRVYLRALKQWEFYEGLLEGLPTAAMNRRSLERIVAENRRDGAEPLVFEPTGEPLEYHGGKYPFGDPEAYPGIVCVARFESLFPTRDNTKDCSQLVVIWFQHEFAFPIHSEVLARLKAMDWDKHAVDLEY